MSPVQLPFKDRLIHCLRHIQRLLLALDLLLYANVTTTTHGTRPSFPLQTLSLAKTKDSVRYLSKATTAISILLSNGRDVVDKKDNKVRTFPWPSPSSLFVIQNCLLQIPYQGQLSLIRTISRTQFNAAPLRVKW